ncbi:MAG: uroporphyrinogen-III C-methyltransferase [Polyangiales bacterium]
MPRAGKVYLLGAGPGDPELVTARALRRLAEADVVLYDALVHPDILTHARTGVELVFVGKRGGQPSVRQAAINARLVDEARAGRIVARLKGGDPYLFGRGSEEAEYLHEHGIAFEVVPGVPSPIAATAYAGLSLTHRDLASSVAYITATESDEKERTSHDWAKLATATQTLVIFMGVRKLRTQMELLARHGRSPETPVAVIQNASKPEQKTVVGTVATIADLVDRAGIGMPALTIVGEVVRLREHLRWFDTRPLFGRRVLVTRAQEQASTVSRMLRDAGAEPVEAPTIRIVAPADPAPLREAAKRVADYDYVVFTSQNAVERFFEALDEASLDARALARARVGSVGPKTTEALRARGIRPDTSPAKDFHGEAMAAAVLRELDGKQGARVLLPRARIARDTLPDTLRAAGIAVDTVVAYDTVPPSAEEAERIRSLFREGALDAVLFTSSSTVENLVEVLGPDANERLRSVVTASIGPVTSDTAEKLGIRIDVTAPSSTTAALVAALEERFSHDD